MKKQNKINELKEAIKEKESQLEKLIAHVDKSSICSELYNKVVLEKAILNKELGDSDKNKLFESLKRLVPREKKLISDYFKKG